MNESDKSDCLELIGLLHDRARVHVERSREVDFSQGRGVHITVADALDEAATRIQAAMGRLPGMAGNAVL